MDKVRILVAEDEVIIAHSLRLLLERLGYAVVGMVTGGSQAVSETVRLMPDLVLMDIGLDDVVDGIAAAQALGKLQDAPPVIFLTAYADDRTIDRARIATPYGYILKPFDERELQICIEMALYKHRMERRLRLSEQRFVVALKSIGEAVVTTDVGGNITFLNFLGEMLLRVPGGQGALDRPLEALAQFAGVAENPLRHALRTGQVVQLEEGAELRLAGGETVGVEGSVISPIISDGGEVMGTVVVFRTPVTA